MWAIVLPYLLKFGVPLALTLLEKSGALNAAEAELVKLWIASKDIKATAEFPPQSSPPTTLTPSNINKNPS